MSIKNSLSLQEVVAKLLRLEEKLKKRVDECGFELQDVDDKGHCQFEAVAHQVRPPSSPPERDSFIDNLLVRIHYIIVMAK